MRRARSAVTAPRSRTLPAARSSFSRLRCAIRYFCGARKQGEPVWNLAADGEACGGGSCDLYQLDATAYESVLVGQMALLRESKL